MDTVPENQCDGAENALPKTRARRAVRLVVFFLLAVHAGLLAGGAWLHSPTWDEVGHLPAGISHWRFGHFDLYRVNPPLVRLAAAVPVTLAAPEIDWRNSGFGTWDRGEWPAGRQFIKEHGARAFGYFALARWACIPFSLLGAIICFRWARELYGSAAGFLALTLWCFSPNILGNGQLITPDVGAAALGGAAAYLFWHWLKTPTWMQMLGVGFVLGLAELTKFTWIVLFGVWPALWVAWRWKDRRALAAAGWFREAGQLAVMFLVSVYVINLGYGFEGSLRRLDGFAFVSRTLAGTDGQTATEAVAGNRFKGTWLGTLPVPLPANFVLGVDRQKREFEDGYWSYLRGEWRHGGWWYYYLYALAIKVPLGTWVLVLLALAAALLGRGYAVSWRDELMLIAPIGVVLVLVSSQTGFNHHLRYVLPAFPFAFIWMSKVARAIEFGHRKVAIVAGAALLWSTGSSLYYYPHSLSYFNELVGGPKRGHEHLVNSNIDWGQDLLYLKRWYDAHPEARPLHMAYFLEGLVDPETAGIDCLAVPLDPQSEYAGTGGRREGVGPHPGWYAVSVCKIRSRDHRYEYFLEFEPTDYAGYGIYIYHITPAEANRVRRKLGLAELRDEGGELMGDAGLDHKLAK